MGLSVGVGRRAVRWVRRGAGRGRVGVFGAEVGVDRGDVRVRRGGCRVRRRVMSGWIGVAVEKKTIITHNSKHI